MTAAFQNRFDKVWSAHSPLTSGVDLAPSDHGWQSSPRFSKILTAAAWPLAILLVIHRTFITAFNGTATDDFSTVYNALSRALAGSPVYEQAYHHVDPLYLYNPGATLLLLPIRIIDNFEAARYIFIVANSLAIIAASWF